MIPKLTMMADFGPLCGYVLKADAEIIGGNVLGQDALTLTREFNQLRKLKPAIRKPVWHGSLSAQVGERLGAERWVQVGRLFLKRMGVKTMEHQYLLVQHHDKPYEHIHIVLNRISSDGTVWHNHWDGWRSQGVSQGLEEQFGLRPVNRKTAGSGAKSRVQGSVNLATFISG
ncbi:relaxase/mobilization nuclease domain-containing protein [Candidatus Cyanaurora vandensis]|uniref:relaxase/mobilization nuclease domain-containing protein n=1 Tax=Candidatus Cyanaurora vandensis TaxID=2714958 RepID=UPI00257C1484|nr:relaxase/mobilization nuclease domain-containing protein [Candidatus Cyanaurora vandensis]